MTRTLVAYASKRGSTEEVARAIAARLREAGHHVDVRSADMVTDVRDYDAVVLGGSLYFGRWHGEARAFVHRHRSALGERPLAVFALGPKTLERREVARSRHQLLAALTRLGCDPQSIAIFGGVVNPAQHRFPFNRMQRSDARDWKEIESWAAGVAALTARPLASAVH